VILNETPQGSLLWPVLFNSFLNNLEKIMNRKMKAFAGDKLAGQLR